MLYFWFRNCFFLRRFLNFFLFYNCHCDFRRLSCLLILSFFCGFFCLIHYSHSIFICHWKNRLFLGLFRWDRRMYRSWRLGNYLPWFLRLGFPKSIFKIPLKFFDPFLNMVHTILIIVLIRVFSHSMNSLTLPLQRVIIIIFLLGRIIIVMSLIFNLKWIMIQSLWSLWFLLIITICIKLMLITKPFIFCVGLLILLWFDIRFTTYEV